MHTDKRLQIITALLGLSVTVTVGTVLTAATLTWEDVAEQLQEVLGTAREGLRKGQSLDIHQQLNARIAKTAQKRLIEVRKRERAVRLKMAALLRSLRSIGTSSAVLVAMEDRSSINLERERERMVAFLRAAYTRGLVEESRQSTARILFQRIAGVSLGTAVDAELRDIALSRASGELMSSFQQAIEAFKLSRQKLHSSAGDTEEELQTLRAEREENLREMRKTEKEYEQAQANVAADEEGIREVRAESAEVEAQILRMQGEMAQIEARLRTRAERELIQKGLREARPGRYKEPLPSAVAGLIWPLRGRITAPFRDAAYFRYFGIPHNAIDIATPQGSPVKVAADGVVFLARDGGQRGYSYILVGHRGGYATLYGHLSAFNVSTGDDVHQGQVIGLSGATPGTHGAGPMTTGPHLHFEVIKNGAHVDPLGILP